MCTDHEKRVENTLFNILERIEAATIHRPPIDDMVQLSSTKPYVIDYKERRHVYIWLPSTALALSFEDYGSGTVQPQIWVNLGMPQGIKVFATAITSGTTPIFIRCTDEVIP
jgi:hypothetical protein